MASISLPSERNIRHFILANAVASETTIKTFIDSASAGEMQIFGSDGLNATTAGDFYIAAKNSDGTVFQSDFITPGDITYISGNAPRTKKGRLIKFSMSSDPVVGETYILKFKLHYGLSEENFITFWAEHTATSTAKKDVLSALAKQLNDAMALSINTQDSTPATVTVAGLAPTGTVTIAGSAGSVNTITVGGVEILGGAVSYASSLTVTAAAVAAKINANQSNPKYFATSSAAVVTIWPIASGVSTATVVTTGTTLTFTDVNIGTGSAGTSVSTGVTNKYFEIYSIENTGQEALVIREKDWILDDYRTGLKAFDQILWSAVINKGNDEVSPKITTTAIPGVSAKGEGYQIRELERYLGGHVRDYDFRDRTLELNFEYQSVLSTNYYTLDLAYYDTSQYSPKRANKQLTIACSSNTHLNTIGNAIETRGGLVWTDL